MGRLDGKVAFITGAARGQGRAHAMRMAEEGADIIAVDICAQIETSPVPMATPEDLAETVREVEALDRRIIASQVDIRDEGRLSQAVNDGVAELGRLDIVIANAGIAGFGSVYEFTRQEWNDAIDVMLTGSWLTCKVAVPHLLAGDRGGSIILTSSLAGLKPLFNVGHYGSAKHGEIGLMRSLALELAPHMIRVNAICPGSVDTPMIQNDTVYKVFAPDIENPKREQIAERFKPLSLLPIAWLDARDLANAALFLASDDARYITGVALPVDAGALIKGGASSIMNPEV